jgi:ABC-type multidrug transport system fused ATPase/permease subunit
LDSGKIVEDGTYDELIEKKGFFADLVSRQQVDVA